MHQNDMKNSYLAIVIPAYNENETILNVISNVQRYGNVVIVNDGSSDSTLKTIQSTSVSIISHDRNMGYEDSINSGMNFAINKKYKYIITIDADGELDPTSIPEFLDQLQRGFDVVLGCRQNKNRTIESFFGALTSFLSPNVNDPLCGMKGYSSNVYKKYGFFDSKKMIGTELLAYAIRDNLLLSELAVVTKKREGISRFGIGTKIHMKIFRTIFLFFLIVFSKKV
jgi:glycosyltransferase involved in cell wall biosynthesis